MRTENTRRGQTQKDVQNKTSLSRLFTSPLAGEDARRAGEGYKNKVILDLIQDLRRWLLSLSIKSHSRRILSGIFHACRCNKEEKALFNNGYVEDPRQKHSGMTPYFITAWGFTLIELLVAIMIIGILAAVAVPQYQKAVMKSRFAAMMPIAKTLANANEVYYAEHDEYSTDPAKLNVTPQAGTPDGTAINMYSNPEEVSFVRVENPGVPNARYVVYQKLSENFPETTWCEAGDTRTEELCVALGGTLPEGLSGNSSGDNTNYKAYLLTGQARSGDTFAETGTETEPQTPQCEGVSCDEQGNITECASGLTLNNGACVTCDIPNATSCSTTSYAPTACSEGYILNGTACEPDPTPALLQALAAEKCPANQTQYVCTIKNGAVYRCDKNAGGTINEQGECVSNGTQTGYYEIVYNPDGTKKQAYYCGGVNSGHCYQGYVYDYAAGTGKVRWCADQGAISKDATCANGYSYGHDNTFDSHGNMTDQNTCSAVNEQGVCTPYSYMDHYDITYDANGNETGQTYHYCTSISGTTCLAWNPPL